MLPFEKTALSKINLIPLFVTDVIVRRRVLLTSSVSSVKLRFSEDGLQALFRSMRSCRFDFDHRFSPTVTLRADLTNGNICEM